MKNDDLTLAHILWHAGLLVLTLAVGTAMVLLACMAAGGAVPEPPLDTRLF